MIPSYKFFDFISLEWFEIMKMEEYMINVISIQNQFKTITKNYQQK